MQNGRLHWRTSKEITCELMKLIRALGFAKFGGSEIFVFFSSNVEANSNNWRLGRQLNNVFRRSPEASLKLKWFTYQPSAGKIRCASKLTRFDFTMNHSINVLKNLDLGKSEFGEKVLITIISARAKNQTKLLNVDFQYFSTRKNIVLSYFLKTHVQQILKRVS